MSSITQKIKRDKLDVVFFANFAGSFADGWLQQLKTEIAWEQREIMIMGKKIPQPRLTAWYSDPGVNYTYSNVAWKSIGWTPLLLEIKNMIEQYSSNQYNSCLLNYYRDGKDSMSYHSDDEPELGKNPVIASLSLGGERNFLMKHKSDKNIEGAKFLLSHGSLLVMQGETQHYWKHAIPKTKKIVPERINLTFRWTGARSE